MHKYGGHGDTFNSMMHFAPHAGKRGYRVSYKARGMVIVLYLFRESSFIDIRAEQDHCLHM